MKAYETAIYYRLNGKELISLYRVNVPRIGETVVLGFNRDPYVVKNVTWGVEDGNERRAGIEAVWIDIEELG